jgi:hypothetical protein
MKCAYAVTCSVAFVEYPQDPRPYLVKKSTSRHVEQYGGISKKSKHCHKELRRSKRMCADKLQENSELDSAAIMKFLLNQRFRGTYCLHLQG